MVHSDSQVSMKSIHLIIVFYTCRLHVDDIFDEIHVVACRGLVMVLFSLFLLHHYFPLILLILSYHPILGSDLGSWPKKVA